jgi:hypothetical protein
MVIVTKVRAGGLHSVEVTRTYFVPLGREANNPPVSVLPEAMD